MADEENPTAPELPKTPAVGDEITQRVQAIRRASTGSADATTTKRVMIGLFLVVGAFFAYVIWRQHQNQTATSTATGEIQQDATAAGQQANLDTQLAAISQSVASENASLSAQLNGVNANVSGARGDASIALNGVNQLLNIAHKTPAPVNVSKKPAPAPAPPARHPIAAHPAATAKYSHIQGL